MKKLSILILLNLVYCVIFAQTYSSIEQKDNSDFDIRKLSHEKNSKEDFLPLSADPQIAMAVPNYPVTAGDVYSLIVATSSNPVHYTILVDTSYKIRVANLGVIKCDGLTYSELKNQVEYLVSKNYPLAGTQFALTNPATFLVSIVGEVKEAAECKAWALTRLSSFIAASVTEYSSTRSVTVISSSGEEHVYDLYKAQRLGDFSQNPYLRPGDKIMVPRAERKVEIMGSVEREGVYELLPDENLSELLLDYASGNTMTANLEEIRLVRIENGLNHLEKILYLNKKDVDENFKLCDKDKIFISDWKDWQPVVELRGIIKNPRTMDYESNVNVADSSSMYKMQVKYYINEDYSSLIRRYKEYFTVFSDLSSLYVERGNKQIVLNADKILQDLSFVSPYRVEKGDVIIVPYLSVYGMN